MLKFGIIVNNSTRASEVDIEPICNYIEEKGGSCYRLKVRKDGGELMENFTDFSGLPKDATCVMAFGGDGTIIQAARELAPSHIPIFGVNLGTVGFLAEVELEHIYIALDRIFEKKFHTEKRFMLRGKVIKEGNVVYEANALNDIVVARGSLIRAISAVIRIDDCLMSRYYCDGVIITTPTGSTGYNLSANGTMFMPDTEIFGITPICPHSLYTRGVVTSSSSTIEVELEWNKMSEPEEALVSFDGNKGIKMLPGDKVVVRKSNETVPFLRLRDFEFLNNIKKKFIDV